MGRRLGYLLDLVVLTFCLFFGNCFLGEKKNDVWCSNELNLMNYCSKKRVIVCVCVFGILVVVRLDFFGSVFPVFSRSITLHGTLSLYSSRSIYFLVVGQTAFFLSNSDSAKWCVWWRWWLWCWCVSVCVSVCVLSFSILVDLRLGIFLFLNFSTILFLLGAINSMVGCC